MGHTKRILSYKYIQPIPTFYSDHFAVELAENFHVHFRNIRLEMDHNEFELVAQSFRHAFDKWIKRKKPFFKKYKEAGDSFMCLGTCKLPPISSLFNHELANDQIRVELQWWADYIHMHYKELKVEFSINEFKKFAEVIIEAYENLGNYNIGNPVRYGKFHRACPHGRVEGYNNNFWIGPSDNIKKQPFASTYEKNDVMNLGNRRQLFDDRMIKLDVNDLYDISLYHSYNINPWGCNEEKVFLPLKNRYEFVKIYFEADGNLTEDIILNSNYYKLLQKDIDETPRDGGNNWVYKSPMDQVKRFIKLMASFRDNGYLGVDNTHNALEEFDNAPEIVSKDGSMQFQSNNDGGYRGLISFRPCSGAYKVHNGLHRLAILKYMWDSGSLASPRIIGRKIDDMPFVPEDTQNVVYDELGYPVGTSANKKNGSKGIFLRKFKKVINGVKTKLNNVGLRIGLF